MSDALRFVAAVACLLLFVYVIHLVKHERLQLKYSLLWLALGASVLVLALIPGPLFTLGQMLGFETTSNFIFFTGFMFLLLIALSLSAIVSKQATAIKNLTQRIAIIECEINRDARGHDDHEC